jgi:hypothetical protein
VLRALTGRIQLPKEPPETTLPARHRPESFREFAKLTIVFVTDIEARSMAVQPATRRMRHLRFYGVFHSMERWHVAGRR